MAVNITSIQASDSLATSRLTLNSNFGSLKAGLDAVQMLINPNTSVLSGVKSVTINDNAVSSSTNILQVGKGSSLLGNVTMGTVGSSTSVLVNGNGGFTITQSDLTLGSGNLTVSEPNSLVSFKGHLSIENELRCPGVSFAFSSVVELNSTSTLTINNLKYLVVSNISSAEVIAQLPAGSPGQVLEIFHIKGSEGHSIKISPVNEFFYGLSTPIEMKETGDTIRVIYDGNKWYLWNYSASSFAVKTDDSSSISFTLE